VCDTYSVATFIGRVTGRKEFGEATVERPRGVDEVDGECFRIERELEGFKIREEKTTKLSERYETPDNFTHKLDRPV
jgi:hypothetical protein